MPSLITIKISMINALKNHTVQTVNFVVPVFRLLTCCLKVAQSFAFCVDTAIVVPNIVGLVISTVQICIYLWILVSPRKTRNGSIPNHNVRHPAVSTTMESQSAICVASPTSSTNISLKKSQTLGGTSGSDYDTKFEGAPFEQSTNPQDVKRMRRMMSNRESDQCSRKRKQAHLADLETQENPKRSRTSYLRRKGPSEQVDQVEQLTDANQQLTTSVTVTDNRILKSDVRALRVKLAVDMVARGALASPASSSKISLKRSQTLRGTSSLDYDTKFEGAPFEQGTNPQDVKRMQRMVSYRESDQCSEQVDHVEQLTDANQQLTTAVTVRDNRKLKSDVRAKVKLAEDVVACGALSCGLGSLGLSSPVLNPQQCRVPDVLPVLEVPADDRCFTGLSPTVQVQNSSLQSLSLESFDNRMTSEVTSCAGAGVDV
ncbi:uncharacterized protein LOC120654857 isoform X2 [Panicum virgatum]|uniref:uncharacterized protein LOC120654857 isoform X2 n=1 Tax=Panicum virgatum TaxID=38727 RepID=UPI0019D5D420|nr:uncharacterized protein LOC120654857 isoform X2 [Panicum virgatum]